MRIVTAAILAAIALGPVLAPGPAVADPGDPAGWSVLKDARKRAFLIYAPRAGGPRTLVLACLTDADTFTVLSAGVAGELARGVPLVLANGGARFEVTGAVELDLVTREAGFVHDTPADARARARIAARLLPVLGGPGPIALSIGAQRATLPVDGLGAPLAAFRSVCFEGG